MNKIDQFLYDNYISWKNRRISFYVAKKNCHIQKIVRVDEATQKIGNFLMSPIVPSLQTFDFK